MAKSKNAVTLSAHVPNELHELIVQRAQRLNLTTSKYTALILKQWVDAGCPPVTEIERELGKLTK